MTRQRPWPRPVPHIVGRSDERSCTPCQPRYHYLVFLGMARDPIKGHLDLLLLRILQDGPAHGYEVITALRERSDGTFDLPEGTVYPALHRLEGAGLLASTWDTSGARRRRVYSLT